MAYNADTKLWGGKQFFNKHQELNKLWNYISLQGVPYNL